MNEIHFGKLVKLIIDNSGDTKEEAAKRLKYSRNNLFLIFRKKDVSTEVLKKISEAYRVDLTEFICKLAPENPQLMQAQKNTDTFLKVLEMELAGLRAENQALKDQIGTLKEIVQLLKNSA